MCNVPVVTRRFARPKYALPTPRKKMLVASLGLLYTSFNGEWEILISLHEVRRERMPVQSRADTHSI